MADVNITSYNQLGGITAQNVHIGAPQRHVDGGLKQQIREMIPKEQKVVVMGTMGDGESLGFAQEVLDYMTEAGFNVEGLTQAVWTKPLRGQALVKDKEPWELQVFHHPG